MLSINKVQDAMIKSNVPSKGTFNKLHNKYVSGNRYNYTSWIISNHKLYSISDFKNCYLKSVVGIVIFNGKHVIINGEIISKGGHPIGQS